ncbi:hypothetical protein BJV78DRAFT_1194521 [Lactifluus subvellereus]|nr:hypothetical protein BJV78DRAFT_1194521 [Lactifluus subvellereus]
MILWLSTKNKSISLRECHSNANCWKLSLTRTLNKVNCEPHDDTDTGRVTAALVPATRVQARTCVPRMAVCGAIVVVRSRSAVSLHTVQVPKVDHVETAPTLAYPLQVVVDFLSIGTHTLKEQNRAAAALIYPNRVRRVAIRGTELILDRAYRAVSPLFLALESFKILFTGSARFHFPTTILMTSAPSPQSLHLDIDTVVCQSPAASLLTYLQGMRCPRQL